MNLSAGYPEPELGIVVPAFNEAENVPILFREIADAMDAAGCDFQMLVVDDGSSDGTADVVRRLAETDSRVCGLVLTRNFGHQAAISVGLSYVRGEAVAIMDADLQDRPSDTLKLLR